MKEFATGIEWATGIFALVAFLMAFASWVRLGREFNRLRAADIFFERRGEGPPPASQPPPDLTQLANEAGIPHDSHVAEVVELAMHGARADRLPTLDEVRGFVLKKERATRSAQFPRFVRSILLLVGIIGTLFALKPVLAGFSEGGPIDPNVDKITSERVAAMVGDLSGSFMPTLIALFCTVVVSFPLAAHEARLVRLALAIERFAFTRLFSIYKPPSTETQMTLVAHNLAAVAEVSQNHTKQLAEASASLIKITDSLKESCATITGSVGQYGIAAGRFETASQGIADTMSQYLGAESPLVKMILALDGHRLSIAGDRSALEAQVEKLNHAVSSASQSLSEEIGRQVSKAVQDLKASKKEAQEEQSRAAGEVRKTLAAAEQSLHKTVEFLAKHQSEKMSENMERLAEVVGREVPGIVGTAVAASMKESMSRVEGHAVMLGKAVDAQRTAAGKQQNDFVAQLAELAIQSAAIKETIRNAGNTMDGGMSRSLKESERQISTLKQMIQESGRQRQAEQQHVQQVVKELESHRGGQILQSVLRKISEFRADFAKWFRSLKKGL